MKNWAKKNKYLFFLLAFMMCVFYYTVLGRPQHISDSLFDLFWSYKEVLYKKNIILLIEIILNIFLFIPIGILTSAALSEKVSKKLNIFISTIVGLAFSLTIELCQYYFFRGTAELDDLFNNTIGTFIGSIMFVLLCSVIKLENMLDRVCPKIGAIFVAIAVLACLIADNTSINNYRQLAFQVTNSETIHNELTLDGFCFTYGFDLMDANARSLNAYWNDSDYVILLKSLRTGILHAMDTTTNIENETINKYFKSKYEYPNTCFKAKIDISKLNPSEEYEVMLKSGRLTLSGETYIKDGRIERTSEKENVKLSVYGTDLQKVVEQGYFKAQNRDNTCIVYQYGKYLFWIMSDNYSFGQNNFTRIIYQIWTTQREKLPSYNKDKSVYFYNGDFVFEEHEVTEQMNSGKYRVACMKIPTEFSVAFIATGAYKEGTYDWIRYFRPRY